MSLLTAAAEAVDPIHAVRPCWLAARTEVDEKEEIITIPDKVKVTKLEKLRTKRFIFFDDEMEHDFEMMEGWNEEVER